MKNFFSQENYIFYEAKEKSDDFTFYKTKERTDDFVINDLMNTVNDLLQPLFIDNHCSALDDYISLYTREKSGKNHPVLVRHFIKSFNSMTDALTALTIFIIRPIQLLFMVGNQILDMASHISYAVIQAILAAVTLNKQMLDSIKQHIKGAAINLLLISLYVYSFIPNMCLDLFSLFTRTCVTAKEMVFQKEPSPSKPESVGL